MSSREYYCFLYNKCFQLRVFAKKKILIAQVYIVYFVTPTIPLVYPTLLLGIKLSNTSKHLPKIIFRNIICNLFVKNLISLRKPACFFVGFFAFVSYLISF